MQNNTFINRLWIASTAIMVGILWVMTFVHQEQIIKQGKQIKQLEAAMSAYVQLPKELK